jgi:uncharacterized membrane protein
MAEAAVNSALQRARTELSAALPPDGVHRPAGDPADLVRRYMCGWDAADVEALVALLRADAHPAMPPSPSWYQGRDNIGAYLQQLFSTPFGRNLALTPTGANRQSALAVYAVGTFPLLSRCSRWMVGTSARSPVSSRQKHSVRSADLTRRLWSPPWTSIGGRSVAVDVSTEVVIDRPCDLVAAYVADPSHAPEWYVNIDSIEWHTDPPLRVGSRVAFVARFLGRRLEYTYEIVEHDPGRRLVMRTAEGPFPMETTYTWQPNPAGGTTMSLRNRGEPAGFARIGAPAMAAAMRRANRKDLARLKQLLDRSST